MTTLADKKRKVQRVKLQLHNRGVKWDASIVAADPIGRYIDVEFDGPLNDVRLWSWGELWLQRELKEGESPAQFEEKDCPIWRLV